MELSGVHCVRATSFPLIPFASPEALWTGRSLRGCKFDPYKGELSLAWALGAGHIARSACLSWQGSTYWAGLIGALPRVPSCVGKGGYICHAWIKEHLQYMEGTKKDFQYMEDSPWQARERWTEKMGCDFPGTSRMCHAYSGIINFSEPGGGTVVWQQLCREQSVILPSHTLTVSQWTPRHPSPWGAQMRTQPGMLCPTLHWPRQHGSALCFRKNLVGRQSPSDGERSRKPAGKGYENWDWEDEVKFVRSMQKAVWKWKITFSRLMWMWPLQEEELRFNIQIHLY